VPLRTKSKKISSSTIPPYTRDTRSLKKALQNQSSFNSETCPIVEMHSKKDMDHIDKPNDQKQLQTDKTTTDVSQAITFEHQNSNDEHNDYPTQSDDTFQLHEEISQEEEEEENASQASNIINQTNADSPSLSHPFSHANRNSNSNSDSETIPVIFTGAHLSPTNRQDDY